MEAARPAVQTERSQSSSLRRFVWCRITEVTALFPFLQQVVGSDIAELLMHSSQSDAPEESDTRTLIDFSEGPAAEEEEGPVLRGDDLLTGSSSFSSQSSEKALQGYTQLLLAGRKKV